MLDFIFLIILILFIILNYHITNKKLYKLSCHTLCDVVVLLHCGSVPPPSQAHFRARWLRIIKSDAEIFRRVILSWLLVSNPEYFHFIRHFTEAHTSKDPPRNLLLELDFGNSERGVNCQRRQERTEIFALGKRIRGISHTAWPAMVTQTISAREVKRISNVLQLTRFRSGPRGRGKPPQAQWIDSLRRAEAQHSFSEHPAVN